MKRNIPAVMAIGAIMLSSLSNAAVVTFGDGVSVNRLGYIEAGMITSGDPTYFRGPYIRDWPATTFFTQDILGGPESGERELSFFERTEINGGITFTPVAGGTFDLISFDVENPGEGIWGTFGTARVYTKSGLEYEFDPDAFGTHTVNMRNIKSFTMGCRFPGCQVTIDNITFTSPVPEPSTAVLMLLSLVIVAVAAKSGIGS